MAELSETGLPGFEMPHEFGFVQQNRRALLLAHVDIERRRGLEVGPYDQPTVSKDETDVHYLDVQSRAELIRPLKDPAVARRIPEVDVLYGGADYAEAVDGRFDYVIANHVLEHVPNPIAWLRMIAGVLSDDGVLFLSLPDKKYTFDRYRPDTPLSHVLYDFYTGVTEVSREHVLETELYYDMEFIDRPMDVADRLDDARLRRSFDIPLHPGIHCHVFQAETFEDKFLRPLQHMGLIPFELVAFRGSKAETGGEFSLVLRRTAGAADVGLQSQQFFTKDYEQQPIVGAGSGEGEGEGEGDRGGDATPAAAVPSEAAAGSAETSPEGGGRRSLLARLVDRLRGS